MKLNLVFLPGLLCDAALWQPVLRRCDQAFGHAWAETHALVGDLTQDDTVSAMAERVLAAATARFNQAPFGLVGLSMGGYVAFAIMRQQPHRVSHLALFDTNPYDEPQEGIKRRQVLIRQAQSGLQTTGFRGVTRQLLPNLIHPSRLHDAAVAGEVMAMAARIGREGFIRQQQAIMARPDSRPDLPRFTLPSLVAVGEDDQITPPKIAKDMAQLMPQAEQVTFPQCGHLPPLECPDLAFAALQALWQR
ncbi:MAG: alpha/beta hydrolase [Candidatus Symbiobacter sp.]|nr:alpha/beta hydrolase [Candidatus Symbiobacter sp.]